MTSSRPFPSDDPADYSAGVRVGSGCPQGELDLALRDPVAEDPCTPLAAQKKVRDLGYHVGVVYLAQ